MIETDSHFILNLHRNIAADMLRFRKDTAFSESNVEVLDLDPQVGSTHSDGMMAAVGNKFIRSYYKYLHGNECSEDENDLQQDCVVRFYDENFNKEHELTFGSPCIDEGRAMDYINPDSIYYVYNMEYNYGGIGIACFSSDGKLHFNHILEKPVDSVMYYVFGCKATTDGGVLVWGDIMKFDSVFPYNNRGFLLYYHPTKDINVVQEHVAVGERKVFPNPARTQFTVTNTEDAEIKLYNIVGQEVYSTYSTEKNTIVSTEFFPHGVYVLKVVKDNVLSVHKVVVGG
jgi:hypothetical protein